MIGARIYVKRDLGIISSQPMPGAELDLALLARLVAVIVFGPGRISLDHELGIEPSEASVSRETVYAALHERRFHRSPVAHGPAVRDGRERQSDNRRLTTDVV